MFKESHFLKKIVKGFNFIKLPVIITGILLITTSCKTSYNVHYQKEIDSISARFVPDHRVGICNIISELGEKGTIILTGETTNLNAKSEIIKTLNKHGISLIDSIIILPDTLRSDKYMGLITLSVINLRKEPDHAAELVSQAILGTPVLILKKNDSWLMIQTPDNYIAWTEQSSVELMSRKEMAVWKKDSRVVYLENTGWLYDTIKANSGVVSDLVGGSIIKKTGEIKDYLKVELPDGREGFVEKQKVLDFDIWRNKEPGTEESICKIAVTYLGLPYLWGGTSPKAVDCSGFVQSVYFRNGLILMRDASLQANHGLNINIADGYNLLRKGDLLFFGSGISHITHAAIYLGNSEYINASGRVMINSLDSKQKNYNSYRANSLQSAKRIIGDVTDSGIIPVNKHPWY